MNKVLIAYKSNYGSTKKYAAYIAEKTGGTLLDTQQGTEIALDEYKTVVFCGALYAGKLNGLSYISGNKAKLRDKNIVILSVGTMDITVAGNVQKIEQMVLETLPVQLHSRVKIFYAQGTVQYHGLSIKHKIIMWMLYHATKRKNKAEMSPDDISFIKTYGKQWKEVDIDRVDTVVEYIEKFYKKK